MTTDAGVLNSSISSNGNDSDLRDLSRSEAEAVGGGWIVPVGGFLLSVAGRLTARSLGATVLSQVSLGFSTYGLATYFGGDTPPGNPRSRE
jgi:hypothetical protein